MAELGYVPNQLAQSLAQNRSRLVACFVPTLASSIFEETVRGLADSLRAHGYSLLIGSTDYDRDREVELVRTALGRRADGLVLTGAVQSEPLRRLVEAARVPVVETWGLPHRPIDMVAGFSNEAAAREMVSHLITCGYRRIVYAGRAGINNDRAASRRAGYVAGLKAAGLEVDPRLMMDCENTLKEGRRVLDVLRPALASIDAIMFSSDNLAAGAWLACSDHGLRVPGDVAISGFGGSDLASEIPGGITTIDVGSHEIGRSAGELLAQRWSGTGPVQPVVDLGYRLLARRSTMGNTTSKPNRPARRRPG